MKLPMALLAGLAWMICAGVSWAAESAPIPNGLEATLLVTGFVEIDAAGQVTHFGVDRREMVPAAARALVEQAVPAWRFEPVRIDGQATAARRDMSLRVVARPDATGHAFTRRITGAAFGERLDDRAERRSVSRLRPPEFPALAMALRASGTVHLLVKAGPDGRVQDVFVEQVNLIHIDDGRAVDVLRAQLSEAARGAALKWRLQPSRRRGSADAPFWLIRVPVAFNYSGSPYPPYGQWQGYLRGPWQLSPWFAQADPVDVIDPPDALPSHVRFRPGSGLRLLTPLQ